MPAMGLTGPWKSCGRGFPGEKPGRACQSRCVDPFPPTAGEGKGWSLVGDKGRLSHVAAAAEVRAPLWPERVSTGAIAASLSWILGDNSSGTGFSFPVPPSLERSTALGSLRSPPRAVTSSAQTSARQLYFLNYFISFLRGGGAGGEVISFLLSPLGNFRLSPRGSPAAAASACSGSAPDPRQEPPPPFPPPRLGGVELS